MFVYLVYYQKAYEENEVIGVFSSYNKARIFDLDYCAKYKIDGKRNWTEIRKVELDKVDYGFFIGEEV